MNSQINQVSNKTEIDEIDSYFGKMWKEEFDLDRYNKHEQYRNAHIFYIKDDSRIISAITIHQNEKGCFIGRFGTLQEYRGKGYGGKLMRYLIGHLKSQGIESVSLHADEKQIPMYEKFGFTQLGETEAFGNTKAAKMKLKIKR